MKKRYKAASLAIAGVLATQALIPMSAIAEEEDNQVLVEGEATPEAADTAERTDVAEPSDDTNDNETTEVTVDLSKSTDDTEETLVEEEKSAEEALAEEALAEEAPAEETPAEETPAEKSEEDLLEEELLNDEELELLEAKADEDFNGDGISDLYTKMLCEGQILTETGKKVFGDYSYLHVQSSNDLDSDGLINCQEVVIKEREDGSLYAIMSSDPCKADTDNDGISDNDDTDKWHRGLLGGVVGNVRLVARHDDSKDFHDGHVYIVYTSYVNDNKINIDNLYGYYITNPDKKALLDAACDSEDGSDSVVSWRSTLAEIEESEKTDANEAIRKAAADGMYVEQTHAHHEGGYVTLNRGDYVSIGNYGMSNAKELIINDYIPYLMTEGELFFDHIINEKTEGGVWINRELYNQKYAYDQGPNEIVEQEATEEQLNVMLNYFSSHSYFNEFTHNCTTVAAGAWNEVYGTKTDENGNKVKTEYYVNSGTPIKTSFENPFTNNVVSIDTQIDYPGAVKNSIKSMKDIPGYIGSRVYVAGKKVTDTIAKVLKFDISKLFKKKDASNSSASDKFDEYRTISSNSSSGSASSSSSLSHVGTVDIITSVPGTEDLVGEEVEVINAASSLNKKSVKKTASVATDDEEPTEETSETEEVTDDTSVAEEEIVKGSTVEEEIEDTPVPLSTEKSNPLLWVWATLLCIIAAGGIAIAIVFVKKK
ncbi:hypothetical protein [Pseudobutyrivibrio xylanivorans]|uniref:Uncharacterized protein n=1 Tax=Pseudobutyrivibrio xylanivorans DSM 14809 TaxID=1123012 RepID=A0A1M6AS26_PSEXY|nr:hypothetical protein [Pseudobutyrivibrio xylanivorans]SHI39227.1 hypothetical protein SAMN02745725_00339 [Pseudobutyrivibrio xylanivorans DSM 14809]